MAVICLGEKLIMRRFWVEPEFIKDGKVSFTGESYHHLVHVSRFGVGDDIEVLCGGDHALKVVITEVTKKSALGEVRGQRLLSKVTPPYIHLVLGLPRPQVIDSVLEKAVELGCKSVLPVTSDHSQKNDGQADRSERYLKIVKAATEQSGRADLMEVGKVQSIKGLLNSINLGGPRQGLFLYEGVGTLTMKEAVTKSEILNCKDLWVFIGSEGGFSTAEVQLFQEHKLFPATMGSQILRTETACVATLSVLKYEFGKMS